MLSKASVTLLASAVVSVGIIYYVHNQQEVERIQMHSGVIRDIERQQHKRRNKQQNQQQIQLDQNKQIADQ